MTCTEDTITLQRGTDLVLTGTLEDEEGDPINLTGYTAALDQHPALGATISITDAAAGEVEIVAQYATAWTTGRIMHLRVKVSLAGRDTAFPKAWVEVA
jgi:hypothetical protein